MVSKSKTSKHLIEINRNRVIDTEYKLVDVKGEIVGKWLRKIKKSELPIIKYINNIVITV